MKSAAKNVATLASNYKEEIETDGFVACIFVTDGYCLAITISVSVGTNSIATASGNESKGNAGHNIVIDTALGYVSFGLRTTVEKSAEKLKMEKTDFRLMQGTRNAADGAVQAGSIVKKYSGGTTVRGGCRMSPSVRLAQSVLNSAMAFKC